jgi:enoyl-CoA hydratase/carnithine racemase
MTPDVLSETRNHIAFITLNRPGALNALSLEMISMLRTLLEQHAADGKIFAVVLEGAGDKAFCAGGDMRAVYRSFESGGSLHHEFFAAEYPVDFLLYSYPKPYAVLMDGITMGGGMGISQGSKLRIVGERTRIAMPEVAIGFFPDVGGSFFLSRLAGKLGTYLALTGLQIQAADALYCRLADFYLPPAAIQSVSRDLQSLTWGNDPAADMKRFFEARAAIAVPEPAPLSALRAAIDAHFSQPSVHAILASLEAERRPEYGAWAQDTVKLMRSRSPTMLSVTLQQLERGTHLSLADCLRMELNMAAHSFEQGDLLEGLRAVLVDKDNAPRWQPGRIEEVTNEMVSAFFRERWSPAAHPLARLGRLRGYS